MNNENEPEIDIPEENESAGLPLAVVKKGAVGSALPADQIKTPQQLRVMEVGEALAPAYAKASMLALTDEEIAGLTRIFPDSAVEIRPHDGLIYIPHIHVSDRLNGVLKPGQWSLICRRHWLEGNTMYGEYILLIKGCYVGESVGGHPYQPNNPKVNYSDTLESTAAEALRRICGKRLSCGSQVWNPEYARNWVAKYAGQSGGKWFKKGSTASANPQSCPTIFPAPAPKPSKVPASPESCLKKFLENLEKEALVEKATQFMIDLAWLMPNEPLKKIPLRFVPQTGEEYASFLVQLTSWVANGRAAKPFDPHWEDKQANESAADPAPAPTAARQPKDDEAWRDVIVPIPPKGVKRDAYMKNPQTIGQLFDARHGQDEESQSMRQRLWGFVNHFEPKGWEKRDGTKMPPSDADKKFRVALDQFQAWFERNHPDEKL